MNIIATSTLTTGQEEQIKALQERAFHLEQLGNEVYLSSEMNIDKEKPCFFMLYESDELVSFLCAFFPSPGEVEFNGFTHPSHRKKGYFTTLVQEALKQYQHMPFKQALFQCEINSKCGKAYLRKRYPTLDRSEYVMALERRNWKSRPEKGKLIRLTKVNRLLADPIVCETFEEEYSAATKDLDILLSDSERDVFVYEVDNQIVGMLNVHHENEERVMLHGVAIHPDTRGKGYGRAMMCLTLDEVFRSVETLLLEVDSENPPALALYRNLGFQVCSQVDYHRLIL